MCYQSENLKWIIDDGHGWLRINKYDYIRSNFKASRYSYFDDLYVYLEEDCDAPGYINEHNVSNDIPEQYHHGYCFVRDLDSFETPYLLFISKVKI